MKTVLRIALPPLRALDGQTPIAFALLGRERRVLRAGELPLPQLAQAAPGARIEAVLHPADTVVTALQLPPLGRRHQGAAVAALVEPLALSAVQDLAIAHAPRQPDGQVAVAWMDRALLAQGWQRLEQAGLQVADILPTAAVLPPGDAAPEQPLALPADARWQGAALRWSLALPELRPAGAPLSRWRRPLWWAAGAAAVWLLGLNLHASQLRQEAQALRHTMQQQVRQAFPDIPVVVDALKQATQRRDSLRAAQGTASDSDFMPLALSAAQLLPAARTRVEGLRFEDGVLHLDLEEDPDAPAAPDAGPIQQAASLGLSLSRTEQGWRLERAAAGSAPEPGGTPRVRLQGGLQ
ncbi:type II secretion system protein GspL [Orrella sp. JC864]|uniref:type II secretion system protein GspL n=1 Tax=Orrella sp. JC864 TaxID=3120298 RepID=UPI0030097958